MSRKGQNLNEALGYAKKIVILREEITSITFTKSNKIMVAIESNGVIDQQGYLKLNAPLHIRNQQVRVLVLLPDDSDETNEWLKAASTNPVFDFLHDQAEDIYTLADGNALTNEK